MGTGTYNTRAHRSHRMWDPVRRIGRTINVRIRIKPGVDLAAPEWTARGGGTYVYLGEGHREVGPVAGRGG